MSMLASYKMKPKKEVRNIYNFIVICLNISSIVMGLYLLVLGLIDFVYGDNFVDNDLFWRHSWFCKCISIILFASQINSCEDNNYNGCS